MRIGRHLSARPSLKKCRVFSLLLPSSDNSLQIASIVCFRNYLTGFLSILRRSFWTTSQGCLFFRVILLQLAEPTVRT